jgi:DNA-binding CsgD family transcriptional regulator
VIRTDFAADPSAEIFGKLLSCSSPASMCADVLEPLADALSAQSAVFLQFVSSPYDSFGIGASRYIGGRPDAVDAYMDGLYRLDPVIQPAIHALNDAGQRVPSVTSASFEMPKYDDRYASIFLKPFDIGHVMAVAVPFETEFSTQLSCIGLHRPYGDRPFLPEHLAWFKRLVPALSSVLHTITCLETLEISRALIHVTNRQNGELGYVILDEDLVVRSANAAGVDAFGLGGSAHASILGDVKELLLRDPPADGASRRLTPRENGQPVAEIEVQGFRSGNDRPHYLVTSAGSAVRSSLENACQALGFTRRESETARLIAAGRCNASLATELGISFRTVENHLRAIYRKAGVGSRTQLISRLLHFS